MELQGLHGQVVDQIGLSLAAEETRAGEVLRLEDVQERYGVSRTVAREAVRVLESKRVVTSRPRVGITVRPMTEWNLYDPQVIRWRLNSPHRGAQLRELAELRAAVEPSAAALAAASGDDETCKALLVHARAMATAAAEADTAGFVAADAAFHRALLSASGNGMFAQLAEVTEELLTARRELSLMPERVDEAAVRRHQEVAQAVAEGRPADAAACVRSIVDTAHSEVEGLLSDTATPPSASCALDV
ncbi:FCD domain-containing protein [Streptomyces sp. NBS 14/10]|uniref:FadR/GntR family transcriptional regulator n=1 Tax=Streptomyces sp. NBS 14/10 TaxID=1945643 RepID=UPI000B7F3D75|nr:FCD domain-containing protein [Streptomyces sp. NBS 14/10]KAK1185675.1 FCD domain-containing protein [Streptomyces sp. NBS 14/10]NUP40993.1 FadR family transcriptional regulator [Streptomyces sp.]